MKPVFSLCAVATLVCLLVVGAGAVTVTVDKHDYTSGETISARVVGMNDGTAYSMRVTVDQSMKAGIPSAFGNTNVTWPFAHRTDSFNVTNVNTTQNAVIIEHWWPPETGKGHERADFNGTSVNGVFTRTFIYENDQTGNYTSRWIATPIAGAPIVTSIFTINGTKLQGPANFTVDSSIATLNPAVAWVEIWANNTQVMRERFTIDAAATPIYVPTLGPDSGSSSDSGSYTGSSSVIATTTAGTSGTGASGTGAVGANKTPVGNGTAIAGTATPAETATPVGTGGANAATTTAAGAPFAFAALGALGCAALLLAGRVRR